MTPPTQPAFFKGTTPGGLSVIFNLASIISIWWIESGTPHYAVKLAHDQLALSKESGDELCALIISHIVNNDNLLPTPGYTFAEDSH